MELVDWSAGVVPNQLKPVLPDPSMLERVYTKKRDSFHTAPGYREIAVEYSCIPDALYPWNPTVMRDILAVAPDAVPMWVRWVFRSPEEYENPETIVFGRHALGRKVEHLRSDVEPFHCFMPNMPCQGLKFARPNRVWFIHEGPHPEDKYKDLPGDYRPFDHSILETVIEMAEGFKMTEKEYKKHLYDTMIEAARRARAKRKAAIDDDMEMRSRSWHSYADKIIETISDVEMAEYNRSIGHRQ